MKEFEQLLDRVKAYDPKADLLLIKKAFNFASQVHREHKRLSGEPYIVHPIAVASILVDLEQDAYTLCAALLHDVVEDSEVSRVEISNEFGPEVAKMVDGVTKLGQLSFVNRETRQAENFRKMFVAMGEDFRIIVIKLADRLHNMRTLQYLPEAKQQATALETREIFAPLAHRLGVWKIKWELEDLAFTYLEKEKYAEIKERVSESRVRREKYIQDFIDEAVRLLKKVEISAEINGRAKHFFSIYQKMVEQNLEFEEIYDLTAVRIIVEDIKECYAVLGVVHAAWKPIPGRFKDYIAMPKSNGYQSLHTTVIGPSGRPVEIQIRTKEMHRVAEYGIAAHWRYKEGTTDKGLDQKMAWFRQMLEWQDELKDAQDFMESLKTDLSMEEVFVFTPKGDVFGLQAGSTPVDFAYRVHTEVGHRSVGAKVNGRIVPLDHKLKNGDIIEIMTGKKDAPSQDWIRFVKTAGARVKIRNWFKKHDLLPEPEKVKPVVVADEPKIRPMLTPRPKPKAKSAVIVSGLQNVLVKFSKCCGPIPGDKIVGFVTRGRGIAVHKGDCHNITGSKETKDKFVKVDWNPQSGGLFPVAMIVEARDRVGLLKDILGQIVEVDTNISSAKIISKTGSTALIKIIVDVQDAAHLEKIFAVIRKMRDVYDVRR